MNFFKENMLLMSVIFVISISIIATAYFTLVEGNFYIKELI